MARAIWSGVLSFGLVSVPVALYSATEAHRPAFHQFEEGTGDRIRNQRVNERTGDEVEYSDVVKGADVGSGNYVMLGQEELNSVAPGRSRSLDIHAFVNLDEIDAIYFDKTYFLGPGGDEAVKRYALLRDAIRGSGKAAIASFVMRGKEYLAAVRPDDDLMVLETLFFADEVRDPHAEIDNLPGKVKLSRQEMNMARQLVDSMSGPWVPSDYRDTCTDRVNDLIEAKKNEQEVRPATGPRDATNVADLTEALRASVDSAKKTPPREKAAGRSQPGKAAVTSKAGARAGKKTGGRKTPAKGQATGQRAKRVA